MATVIPARWLWRARTAAEWTALNEVLYQDEAGLERDTRRWKFGDGVTAWNALPYADASLSVDDLADLIGEDPAAIRAALELGTAAQADAADFDPAGAASAVADDLADHEADHANPHAVTKAHVGLSNVDNTSDANKPVSTAQATADTAVQNYAIQRANHTGGQDASTITSGTLDIARLPAGALERLVVVADQTARFALTTASVQLGDTVKQTDTGQLYYVVDESNLGNANGYVQYTAGAATSVPWSGVSSKPQIITDIAAITGSDDDVVQKIGGTWVSRTMAQLWAKLKGSADALYEPLLSLSANTFRARSSSGAAANKTITDQALALLDDADAATMRATIGAAPAVDIQVFTSSGTWTKPAGAVRVEVIVVAGGGGGGSGRRGAAGTVRCGGGGGGGGGRSSAFFAASALGATESVVVGAGGAGGAAVGVDDTDGAPGAPGGQSSFGSVLRAAAPSGGGGGTNATGTAGAAGSGAASGATASGGAAAAASTTGAAPSAAATTLYTPTGGGAGGGISSGNVESAGSAGGQLSLIPGALAGGTAGAIATGGGNGNSLTAGRVGTGGGGGGSSKTAAAGAGGNGANYGAGGGGGGASLNGFASGAGGNGADGVVVVVTYF